LVHRVPVRVLAKRFAVSKDAIGRHRRNHMTPQMVAAMLTAQRGLDPVQLEELQRRESEGLLGSLVVQRARLGTLSELCFTEGELHAAVAVERAVTANLELVSRLLGQLVTHHQVTHTSVLLTPDYIKLRHTIINALKPYPDAARAVGAALAVLEQEAAEDIKQAKTPLLLESNPC
jgi:hypothetical protein